jgi:hypothetical protein
MKNSMPITDKRDAMTKPLFDKTERNMKCEM